MRVLGLDLGTRRIGVAVSDPAGVLAVPHGVVERSGDARRDRERLAEIVRDLQAERVVVGLPLSLDGSVGPAAQAAVAETEALEPVLGVPVESHDERLSTVSAHRSLAAAGMRSKARRGRVDEVAATVMLQSWLDSRR
ncbi:MAG: Holliday junction resolvase RuvX [Acidimicrobiales bacterium]